VSFSVLRAAVEAPRRLALLVDGREITFAELAVDVRRAMAWLVEGHGKKGGTSTEKNGGTSTGGALTEKKGGTPWVALVGDGRYATLVTLYALIELGWPAVLVHPRWTDDEVRRWLRRSVPWAERTRPWSPDAEAAAAVVEPPAVADDERPLAVVATSGSSGAPKAVVLSRRALAAGARASAANLGWHDDDRWLLSLAVAHVGGLAILLRSLAARRAVVVENHRRFDAARIADAVGERRVTLLSLVPAMLQRLLRLDPPWRPPAHLRAILLGGAAASPTLRAAAAARGWPVLVTYGLTEAGSQVATQPYATRGQPAPGCGPPLPGIEVRIDDGVIALRGATLFSTYLPQDPAHPPFDAGGWFVTGDRGWLDAAGNLHLLGRADEVIITGGENVDPLEVERVLEDHPRIEEACVFGVADDEWGQVVAAALVAAEPPADGELVRHCEKTLAPFKRPRRLAYLPSLPHTATGKVDRRAAAALARALLRPLAPG